MQPLTISNDINKVLTKVLNEHEYCLPVYAYPMLTPDEVSDLSNLRSVTRQALPNNARYLLKANQPSISSGEDPIAEDTPISLLFVDKGDGLSYCFIGQERPADQAMVLCCFGLSDDTASMANVISGFFKSPSPVPQGRRKWGSLANSHHIDVPAAPIDFWLQQVIQPLIDYKAERRATESITEFFQGLKNKILIAQQKQVVKPSTNVPYQKSSPAKVEAQYSEVRLKSLQGELQQFLERIRQDYFKTQLLTLRRKAIQSAIKIVMPKLEKESSGYQSLETIRQQLCCDSFVQAETNASEQLFSEADKASFKRYQTELATLKAYFSASKLKVLTDLGNQLTYLSGLKMNAAMWQQSLELELLEDATQIGPDALWLELLYRVEKYCWSKIGLNDATPTEHNASTFKKINQARQKHQPKCQEDIVAGAGIDIAATYPAVRDFVEQGQSLVTHTRALLNTRYPEAKTRELPRVPEVISVRP